MAWNTDWWKAQKKTTVIADMKLWATLTDDGHRGACYGDNKSNWPIDCALYNNDAKNLPNECYQKIWNSLGCTTVIMANWWKTQTKATVIADMKLFATLTGDGHRRACYGDNKSNWPK